MVKWFDPFCGCKNLPAEKNRGRPASLRSSLAAWHWMCHRCRMGTAQSQSVTNVFNLNRFEAPSLSTTWHTQRWRTWKMKHSNKMCRNLAAEGLADRLRLDHKQTFLFDAVCCCLDNKNLGLYHLMFYSLFWISCKFFGHIVYGTGSSQLRRNESNQCPEQDRCLTRHIRADVHAFSVASWLCICIYI